MQTYHQLLLQLHLALSEEISLLHEELHPGAAPPLRPEGAEGVGPRTQATTRRPCWYRSASQRYARSPTRPPAGTEIGSSLRLVPALVAVLVWLELASRYRPRRAGLPASL